MKIKMILFLSLFFWASGNLLQAQKPRETFEIKNGNFLLNGKEFMIHSGEMHYPRVPQQYWKHRLEMMKAMGLNTVTTYVFWNYHEEAPGKWNWSGEKDLQKFIKTAQEVGLYVIIRPGPYVCAEWEFGGYPWWLQNIKGMEIRTDNPAFLAECEKYIRQLAKQIVPLEIENGGPVIMVQAENEFGSYVVQRKDISTTQHATYLAKIRKMIKDAGIKAQLFTSDASYLFEQGAVNGALATANGETNIDNLKKAVHKYNNGTGPYMVAEYYPGWLEHWAEPFPKVSSEKVVADTKAYLENGVSFNYYMVHGGTNFAFTSGANYDKTRDIQPDLTSYDYDAPISEAGWATPKYKALREVFQKQAGKPLPEIPEQIKVIDFNLVSFTRSLPVFEWIKKIKPVKSTKPLSFEELNQGYGYVLYRIKAGQPYHGKMEVKGLRDYANVYVNGKWIGELNRNTQTYTMEVDIPKGATVDFLVENMGRINYGAEIVHNLKGIISPVLVNGAELSGNWEMYQLPFDKMPAIKGKIKAFSAHQPILKEATLQLDETGDTFLDMRGFGKGIVFVNGHNLGRYWSKVGPQLTLYLPGVWLKKGKNTIQIFEQINDVEKTGISGIKTPILDQLLVEERK